MSTPINDSPLAYSARTGVVDCAGCLSGSQDADNGMGRDTQSLPGLGSAGFSRHDCAMICVIVASWLLIVALIDPRGNFPLSDDWAYGRAVKSFLDTGSIKLPDWDSTNFVAHMLWGALFCLPTGFSFTALRVSTLVLAVIGVVTVYGLLLEVGASRGVALFGAFSLAVNPLYLVLSFTFMTDVPFVTFCLLSLYLLVRGMRTDSKSALAMGLSLACVALLIRQIGLAIFVAAGLTYLAKGRLRARTALIAVCPVLLGSFIQFCFQEWLKLTHRTPFLYQIQSRLLLDVVSHISWRSIVPFLDAVIVFMVYLGLFSFPFLVFLGRDSLKSLFRVRFVASATLVFAVLAAYFLRNKRMPLLPDVLYDFGLGRPVLYDTDTLHLHHVHMAGGRFWAILTLLGASGAVLLFRAGLVAIVEIGGSRSSSTVQRQTTVLLLATGIIYVAPLILLQCDTSVFDRYLLLLVPLSMFIFLRSSARKESDKTRFQFLLPALLSLVLYGAFSVAATHDYLYWNKARWQALNELMQEHNLTPDKIDGGFEFNGWYLYSRSYPNQVLLYINQLIQKRAAMKTRAELQPYPIKSWWWVAGDEFVVTLGPVQGFAELKRYQFPRWLPPGQGSIFILHRTDTGAP